ncbi:MAG: aminotransferase class III-fold pyridoxal phosphate-dependent enzyme [bacterium]|nr:aminotransferase class III-fold pyridoxal phosphate-dependent enzyme [bacterium]
MKKFDVYPIFDIEPIRGEGSWIWDANGQKYLDFYGGHAVISIGHSHPYFVEKISKQLEQLAFYSNSIVNPLQDKLAEKLGKVSGYEDYNLFLVNSGAEANENAIKLAAFQNQRDKVVVFNKGFHGRTSMAVQATDNPKIQTSLDQNDRIIRGEINDLGALDYIINDSVSCVIIEGIQGVGGIHEPTLEFWQKLRGKCYDYGVVLIADEIQSGYGRSGKFFAHQYGDIKPDLITVAKGMGNGFPIGGVLIGPQFEPWFGMLGTTFGGNHLACTAGLAVLEVIQRQNLIKNAEKWGEVLIKELESLPGVKEVRGKGLMLGAEFEFPIANIRKELVTKEFVFTGSSSNPNVLRLLPPLNIGEFEVEFMIEKLKKVINKQVSLA